MAVIVSLALIDIVAIVRRFLGSLWLRLIDRVKQFYELGIRDKLSAVAFGFIGGPF